jgi:hypothetical protein
VDSIARYRDRVASRPSGAAGGPPAQAPSRPGGGRQD